MPDVTIVRSLDAPPERVWQAWTGPAELVAWIWPPRLAPSIDMALHQGGRFHLVSEAAGIGVSGEYLAIGPPARLEFTWRWDGESEQTSVEVDFARTADGTVLTLTHRGFATEEARRDHQQGWEDCLDRLPRQLASST